MHLLLYLTIITLPIFKILPILISEEVPTVVRNSSPRIYLYESVKDDKMPHKSIFFLLYHFLASIFLVVGI